MIASTEMLPADLRASVQDYYGRVIETNRDLETGACCSTDDLPAARRETPAQIHPEVLEKFYGCDSPIPPALDGRTVLDLGYAAPNVEFREGDIEDLRTAGVADASVDVVVSNCVINLSPDKRRVFAETLRVLKPGGELYFADVFADRRVPAHPATDPVLLGECLGGAPYTEDLREFRAGRALPRHDPRRAARVRARRPPPAAHGDADARLRQHGRDARPDALRAAPRVHRRHVDALRAIRLRPRPGRGRRRVGHGLAPLSR